MRKRVCAALAAIVVGFVLVVSRIDTEAYRQYVDSQVDALGTIGYCGLALMIVGFVFLVPDSR